MKPFHTIAVPHRDILEGRLTMDIFAADLWQVYQNKGPDEYKDPDLFFRKTFLTKGLKNLFNVVKKRIRGEGGDAFIQLKTPFGGGKTHAMIALYHKAKDWKAKRIVIVGTELNPKKRTIWGLIEQQLTGETKKFTDNISPGKEDLRSLLEQNQPLLIFIDELLGFVTKAAGIIVGDTTLGAQTIVFIQELTEIVSTLGKVCLVVTLPTSITEHYDENAEIMFQKLQKVTGRVEKIYTPVADDEIPNVIRRRLFSEIDQNEIKDNILELIDYFKKENMLPLGIEPSEYKNKFEISYPFLPDVIECFYHKWGSFPTFQRTRGVLRLLSLVIYDLKDTNTGYISLADLKLENQELRTELLKHIGNEFNSIIAADITDKSSGSKQVDSSLGESYQGLGLGTRTSTAIFLNSFSGGQEKGSTINEIKRSSSILSIPSSIVSEALNLIKNRLFFVQEKGDKYYFTNKPNLNKILLNKEENIEDNETVEIEKKYLLASIKKDKFKIYIWPDQSSDILDDTNLKLIVLKDKDDPLLKSIIETKGTLPRVYRNTIFFLSPLESKKYELTSTIKRKLAFEQILEDPTLELTEEEKKEINDSIKDEDKKIKSKIREIYKIVIVPAKEEFEEKDLGIPTYGSKIDLSKETFDILKSEGILIEKMAPIFLINKYLKEKKYVFTKQIFDSSLKTLGEYRLISKTALKECIIEGVKQGIFGLGKIEDEKEELTYWKKNPTVEFDESEILIEETLCEELSKELTPPTPGGGIKPPKPGPTPPKPKGGSKPPKPIPTPTTQLLKLDLPYFEIPKGKVHDLSQMLNYIQLKFDKLEIKIKASGGSISKDEYENKIKEALKQMGIDLN